MTRKSSALAFLAAAAQSIGVLSFFAAAPRRSSSYSCGVGELQAATIAASATGDSSPLATSADSIDELVNLAYASSLSYLPLDAIANSEYAQSKAPNLKPVVQVVEPKTESGATIFECENNKETIIVACRGSATPKNFVTNLRFQLKPLSGRFDVDARAHEGFQEAGAGLWERLESYLLGGSTGSTAGAGKKKIVFTGHSLGGGTSEICALYAATSSLSSSSISQVTTFGGPCIGDAVFASYVNNDALASTDIKHLVHDADPILANNGPLWERLGFERSGATLKCDPSQATLHVGGNDVANQDGSFVMPAWNILDHCQYMGVFVGPRIFQR